MIVGISQGLGLSVDTVLYGMSFVNVTMYMDTLGGDKEDDIINADDPINVEKIRSILNEGRE